MSTRAQLDVTKLVEQATSKLHKQRATLAFTLEQIELITQLERTNPGAYTPAAKQLTIKRDRQTAAVRMTESFLEALKKAPKQA